MKKKITALVMAAAMCLSVAACGSSDNGGSGDTAKDTYTVGHMPAGAAPGARCGDPGL